MDFTGRDLLFLALVSRRLIPKVSPEAQERVFLVLERGQKVKRSLASIRFLKRTLERHRPGSRAHTSQNIFQKEKKHGERKNVG